MNEPSRESTPWSESPTRKPASRRQAPKYLFALACLATFAALFVSLANRRTARAQPSPAGPFAVAERAAADKLVPSAVPDDQNFAATPFFAAIMERASSKASDDRWPDDFSRADQWPRRVPTLAETADGRKTGRLPTDLIAWKKSFEGAFQVDKPSETRDEIAVSDRPDAAANAQAALSVLETLKPYEPVLGELHAARQRPYSRFNIRYDWDNPWAILLPHLAVIKRTCQLLRLKASAELAAGQAEPALQEVLLMLRLVDAPKDEPLLISQLVRVACLEIAFQPIWEGLAQRRWSDPQLQLLQAELGKVNLIPDLRRVLETERTWANLTIALIRDKRTPNFLTSSMAEEDKTKPWIQEADRAFQTCPREWFDAEQRNYNRLYEAYLITSFDVAAKRVHPRVVQENTHQIEKALRNKDTLLKDHLIFARELLIAPSKTHLKLAGTQGYTDLAVVACALERHRLATGRFPETLVALAPRYLEIIPHDLVNGQALHYQRTDDGQFLLYSVGWNEADDGGELAFFASGRGPEKKEGDWVWRYPSSKNAPTFE